MKRKQAFAMILVATMAFAALAGCGGNTNSAPADEQTAAPAEETTSAPTEETADEVHFDEMQTIDMYAMTAFDESGLEEVEAGINAISEEEINVHVNLHYLDIPTYQQQIGLMLSGGESFDLLMDTALPAVSFATMQAQSELMDISEYLEDYAPDISADLGEYLAATTVGDSVYAVPCYRIYNSSEYIVMRKDILDELGLTDQAKAIASWSDYEAILDAVAQAQDTLPEELQTPAMICNSSGEGNVLSDRYIGTGEDVFADNYGFDSLGDQSKLIYVDKDTNQVSNFFASEDYKKVIERSIDWYKKGYIYKDSATAEDPADTLMLNGITFSYIVQSELGVEASKGNSTGHEVVCVPIVDIPIQTANGTAWAWSVPTTSENPEAAVAFLNLMYKNADIENFLVYGIEGRDYEINEAGEAVVKEDAVYHNLDFWFPNQFHAYPAIATGGDFRDIALENMSAAEVSKYYGFVVDTNEISNEITALTVVLNKYEAGLESGILDIETVDKMNAELEASGLQVVLDYYQNALDEWLENK